MDKDIYKDAVHFLIQRTYSTLAKRILMLFEDLHFDHKNAFDKLCEKYKSEDLCALLEQVDYLDDNKFAHFRKRILDMVGDARREVLDELEKYTITF